VGGWRGGEANEGKVKWEKERMRKGRKREKEWEREGEGKKGRRGNQGRKREGSTISLSLYLHLQQDGIAARSGSLPFAHLECDVRRVVSGSPLSGRTPILPWRGRGHNPL